MRTTQFYNRSNSTATGNGIYTPDTKKTHLSPLFFQPMSLSSIPRLIPLLERSRSRANDFSIGGMLMWADYFHYRYAIYHDTLFVMGVSEADRRFTAFSLPVGSMPLPEAIMLLKEYCRIHDLNLRFSAVPADRLGDLLQCFKGDVTQLTDWSDYIYNATALASLSGKKLSKKRNHVNRFIADNPQYSVQPLSPENVNEAREAYSRWLANESQDLSTAIEESGQTLSVLDNLSRFPFVGLILRDNNGNVVAFTLGEVIGDTLYTHIEKMDHRVTAAGEMINREMANYITANFPNVVYINREEDAGDPGLRQAKLSYAPAIILDKYDVTATPDGVR